jgi:hypothetical protein
MTSPSCLSTRKCEFEAAELGPTGRDEPGQLAPVERGPEGESRKDTQRKGVGEVLMHYEGRPENRIPLKFRARLGRA